MAHVADGKCSLTSETTENVKGHPHDPRDGLPLIERVKALQARFRAISRPGGEPADKAFFDDLSGADRQ